MAEEIKTEVKTDPEIKPAVKGEPITQERLDAEVGRRHKAEKALEAKEKQIEEDAKKALVDQQNFKALWEKDAPKAKLADEQAVAIEAYFTSEVAGLTDEQKALIPPGPAHTRLAWVRQAKDAGFFGVQSTTDKTFAKKLINKLPSDKWFLEITSADPRFVDLSGEQYKEWKAHNQPKPNASVRGGF